MKTIYNMISIKKMQGIAVALVLVLFSLTAQAANKDVENIRKFYNSTKADMAKLQKKDNSGPVHCLLMDNNPFEARRTGERFYSEKTYYYYKYDTESDRIILLMVIEELKSGIHTIYREYLYDLVGNVFAFEKSTYDNNIEKRVYYKDEKMLLYSENNKEKQYMDGEDSILRLRRRATEHNDAFNAVIYIGYQD